MTLILNCEPKIQTLLSLNWLQFRSLCNSNRNSGNDNKNDSGNNSGNNSNRIPNTSNKPSSGIIDMDSWAGYFAYDVVSSLALGRAFGMLKSGSDVNDYMKSVLANFLLSSNLGHLP